MAKKATQKQNNFLLIPYEWVFVVLAFIFGLMFVYQNPPFHSNDEDRHFYRAYSLAYHGFFPELNADSTKIGGEMPKNLMNVVKRFQGFPYQNGQKMNKKMVEKLSKVPLNKNDSEFYHLKIQIAGFLPFIPHAIAIKLSGNANPVTLGYAGRIGGLIFYIVCMFFIIRGTPVYKSVFMLIGLMPMTLYQASSVTYDTMFIVGIFAYLSLFLKVSLSDDTKFGWKHLIYFFLLLFFTLSIKRGHIIFPFILLLIPKHRFKDGLKPIVMYILILATIIISINFNFTDLFKSIVKEISSGLQKSYPFQKDFVFNESLRHSNMLADIPGTISDLWQNILHFRQEWLAGVFGRFGYSYSNLPDAFYILNGLVLLAVVSLSGKRNYDLGAWRKYALAALGILNSLALIAGFYGKSPIGAEMIFGFQGRYFLPLVPFVLFMFYNSKLESKYWNNWGSIFLGAYCFIMLGYTYSQMRVLFYAF